MPAGSEVQIHLEAEVAFSKRAHTIVFGIRREQIVVLQRSQRLLEHLRERVHRVCNSHRLKKFELVQHF